MSNHSPNRPEEYPDADPTGEEESPPEITLKRRKKGSKDDVKTSSGLVTIITITCLSVQFQAGRLTVCAYL